MARASRFGVRPRLTHLGQLLFENYEARLDEGERA